MIFRRIIALILLCATPLVAFSQDIASEFNFQGRLISPNGTPVVGSASADIRIFRTPSYGAGGGLKVWEETKSLVFTNGFFSTVLSNLDSAISGGGHVFADSDQFYELEIEISGSVYPRIPIRATPLSINAMRFQGLGTDSFLLKSNFSATGRLLVSSQSGPTMLSQGAVNQYLVMGPSGPLWSYILPPRTILQKDYVLSTNGTSSDGNDLSWQPVSSLPVSNSSNDGNLLVVSAAGVPEWRHISAAGTGAKALLVREGTNFSVMDPGSSNLVLASDSGNNFSWRQISLDSLIAPGSGQQDKLLSVDSAGNFVWRSLTEVPATPDPAIPANNNEIFKLTWNTKVSPAELQWKKDEQAVVAFHANCNSTIYSNGFYNPVWTPIVTTNDLTVETNGAIKIPKEKPGIYRVTASVTIGEGNGSARLFRFYSATTSNGSSQLNHATIRFAPAPFPYHGSTQTTTFLMNVSSTQDRFLRMDADYPLRTGSGNQPPNDLGNTIVIERLN